MFEYVYKENFDQAKIDSYCATLKWGHTNWHQAKLEGKKRVNFGGGSGPDHPDVLRITTGTRSELLLYLLIFSFTNAQKTQVGERASGARGRKPERKRKK